MTDVNTSDTSDAFTVLPEVWSPETPAIREIFAQIPAAVGVPGVHLLWRLLANFPEVLAAAWAPLAAGLSSPVLGDGARELLQRSFISEAVGLPSHKAFRGDLVRAEIDADFRGKISNFNGLSQYGLSRLLIVAAALAAPSSLQASRDNALGQTRGVPTGAVYVPPLREGEARGKAVEILERVQREHELLLLDDYYRSLGRIPDYLAAAWNAIHPLVNDTEYLARAGVLAEQAASIAVRLPLPAELGSSVASLTQRSAGQYRGLLAYFSRVLLPQTLIDVTLIKALTEGPDLATEIDFNATS